VLDDQHGAFANVPEWDGRSRAVAEVWTLRKGSHVAACSLWTHPIGGEVRLSVNGEMHRTEAKRDGRTLLDLALDWRDQFTAKGWQ
jgi:hypothetical protein